MLLWPLNLWPCRAGFLVALCLGFLTLCPSPCLVAHDYQGLGELFALLQSTPFCCPQIASQCPAPSRPWVDYLVNEWTFIISLNLLPQFLKTLGSRKKIWQLFWGARCKVTQCYAYRKLIKLFGLKEGQKILKIEIEVGNLARPCLWKMWMLSGPFPTEFLDILHTSRRSNLGFKIPPAGGKILNTL